MHQFGVASPGSTHALYLTVTFKKSADTAAIKRHVARVHKIADEIASVHQSRLETVVGFGYNLTKEWIKETPKALMQFSEYKGTAGVFPATGGDLFAQIKSERKDLCWELGRKIYQPLEELDAIESMEELFGFAYLQFQGVGKDLSGFEDGIGNPKTEEGKKEATLIGDEDPPHKGGSYALTQKWLHDLKKFSAMSKQEQENMIGRTIGNNSVKIKPRPEDSHVTRTDVKENGKELKTVRQSMPWGGVREHGLFFLSYASTTHKFDVQLRRMIGLEGPHDQLFKYSKALSGNFWYIPSMNELNELGQ